MNHNNPIQTDYLVTLSHTCQHVEQLLSGHSEPDTMMALKPELHLLAQTSRKKGHRVLAELSQLLEGAGDDIVELSYKTPVVDQFYIELLHVMDESHVADSH